MRSTRCSCGEVVELGRIFCNCGAQMASWPVGQAPPVSGRWLQAPHIAPTGLNAPYMTVVGESYRRQALETIAGGRTEEGAKYRWHTAQLVLEDTNPFDVGNAVMVLIGGLHVGYMPAEECPKVRTAMARYPGQPFTMRALVTGGWLPSVDSRTGFGVELCADSDLRPFDPDRDPFLPGSYQVPSRS